ncbi:sensor histidine kinase [Frondihabitans australicus]|uniref:histidine kinase n=1 Tax=Frondihabitans australicus TaxID=386892 RepID=A0A495IJ50_9MICO|nr:histidine kinase [Frondihabitans australicus]RKR76042.1 signal transduction histidine kinase [Frondihabitans australicus]
MSDDRGGAPGRVAWWGSAPVEAAGDDLLLPKPPGILRRFWSRHWRLADALIAFVGLLFGYLENIDTGLGLGHANWLVSGWFALVLIAAAAIMLRRTRPVTSFAVVAVCATALTVVVGGSLIIPLMLATYAVAVYRGNLWAWGCAAASYGVFWLATLLAGHRPGAGNGLFVVLIFALLAGTAVGNRRRYLDALIDRAAQLARERDQQGQLATAAERSRIAREMHDVVAHSLSVMVRLSDGASAVADSDPARSREAVRQIGEVGRESLRDMRRLLGVLRDDQDATVAPQPTLAELDHLVETYRSTGLPVVVQQRGTPPADSGVQVAVFRAVQETLTNALRYANQPSRVLVQLDYTGDPIVVEVTDDGLWLGPPASVGTGRGLVGLRERAAIHDGSVEAGPRRDAATGLERGWRVRMTLASHTEGSHG